MNTFYILFGASFVYNDRFLQTKSKYKILKKLYIEFTPNDYLDSIAFRGNLPANKFLNCVLWSNDKVEILCFIKEFNSTYSKVWRESLKVINFPLFND